MKLGWVAVVTVGAAMAQYGLKTAEPYTRADIDYGRKQQARIDSQRNDYAAKKITKDAAEPFHIVGDLYWVGIHNWGCALIKTSEGLILIDTTWNDTVPLVAKEIEKLGFKLSGVKILLMTEFHGDHNAGVAWMKEKTGAQLMGDGGGRAPGGKGRKRLSAGEGGSRAA